jgi:hypothetical protein
MPTFVAYGTGLRAEYLFYGEVDPGAALADFASSIDIMRAHAAPALSAARLLGALEAMLERQGFQQDDMMDRENRETRERLTPSLGSGLDAAVAEGRRMAESSGSEPDLSRLAAVTPAARNRGD